MASTITLTFTHSINDSIQVGDTAYYCPLTDSGEFKVSDKSSIVEIGTIKSFTNTSTSSAIVCYREYTTPTNTPTTGSFILFSKNNKVNMSSPLGYYAQVKFVNNSTVKSEMFATSCGVVESSK